MHVFFKPLVKFSLEKNAAHFAPVHSVSFWTFSSSSSSCINLDIFSLRLSQAIDHSFYGFTGAINHAGFWENTRKGCKSRAVRKEQA